VKAPHLAPPGQQGIVDRTLHRGVPPALFGWELVQGVLRVVDKQIRALEEPEVTLVFLMHRDSARQRPQRVQGMRLMIGGVDQRGAVRFQAIPEGEGGMIQILRGDADAPDLEHALGQIVEPDLGVEGRQRDREILVGHLARQARLDLAAVAPWGIDLPDVLREEERRKERKALNVIPMGVPDEEMPMQRAGVGRHQGAPEPVGAGAAIEDHEGAISGAHFANRRMAPHCPPRGFAAIAQRGRPGLRDGATGAPEANAHRKHSSGFQIPDAWGTREATRLSVVSCADYSITSACVKYEAADNSAPPRRTAVWSARPNVRLSVSSSQPGVRT